MVVRLENILVNSKPCTKWKDIGWLKNKNGKTAYVIPWFFKIPGKQINCYDYIRWISDQSNTNDVTNDLAIHAKT